jgi:hypothetical protein
MRKPKEMGAEKMAKVIPYERIQGGAPPANSGE